jgi:two-component system cell cycle sensor histidine kinase/response regulator CckA
VYHECRIGGASMTADEAMARETLLAEIAALRSRLANGAAARPGREQLIVDKYRRLLEGLDIGVFETTLDGRFIDASPRAAKMAGYDDRDDFMRLRAHDLYADPRDRDMLIEALRRDGVAHNHEMQSVRRDGTHYRISISAILSRNAEGGPESILGLVSDISKLRVAEDALRASEGIYNSLVETAHDLIWRCDAEGRYVFLNRAFETTFGYRLNEMIGRPFRDFTAPEVAERDLATFGRLLGMRDGVYNYETVHLHKDGSRIHLSFNAKPVLDGAGNVIGTQGTARDITRAKMTEDALHTAKDFAENLIGTANTMVVGLDAEGNLTIFNRTAEQITGYTFDELRGRNWFEVIVPRDRYPEVWQEFARLSAGGLPERFENPILTKTGQERCIVWQNNQVSERGRIVGTISFGLDVTEARKIEQENARLEEQYRQAQKLEAVGLLAGGVAHDLNNLLTPIIGFGDVLLLDGGLTAEHRESVEEMTKGGLRAKELVQQLTAFARKQTLNVKPLDMNEIVANFGKLLRRTLREDITIDIRLGNLPGAIVADRGQVEQVLMNLAINARDAMPRGGTLTIETREVTGSPTDEGQPASTGPHRYAQLAVRDTGEGMDETTRQRVFEPFFTTKERGHGTGLGLATVYGIVKQHGGEISVASKLGHGTAFEVLFPMAEHPLFPSPPCGPKPTLGGGGETVLVVEDEPLVRRSAILMLERLGYRVLAAETTEQCLALGTCHAKEISLLLTDVVMPGMNGVEFCARLRRVSPSIKVIFMSGYSTEAIADQGILPGDSTYLQKPFTLQALAEKLREVLGS